MWGWRRGVWRHRHAGGESPADAGARDLLRGHPFRLFDEAGVVGGPQPEVMREDRGPVNVVVAMHRVNAVEQRDFQAGLPGLTFEAVDKGQPVRGGVAGVGIGIAAAEHGAQKVLLDVGLVLEGGGIHLHHLADFFIEIHLGQEGVHLGIGLREEGGAVAHGGEGEDHTGDGGMESVHG